MSTPTVYPFQFRGTAKEYFGIWIVNVLLSLVTLGVYASWAKVRNKKYFYGQTFVDDHNFDYHATGMQLFKGKLIVIGVLSVLVALQLLAPVLYLIALLVVLPLLPLIIVRALMFNARVSSHRNVRFNFIGEYGEAFITFLLLPIANLFTLYMITPIISRAANRFTINHHTFGDRGFDFDANLGAYYKPFLGILAVSIIGMIAGFGALFSMMMGRLEGYDGDPERLGMIIILVTYGIMFLVILPSVLFYKACVRNIVFNGTVLDDQHEFKSTVNPWRYVWIIVSNTFAAIFTIGLLVPWGRVRFARYLADNTALITDGSLDGYASSVSETAGVISSEYVDLEGIDMGIGI
ncbi:YjgN family protein [Fretibacter rubidus]|uniref:YjgN family protein n=1 Tax=Fretibacter rubidus TaxID=570162 RepID=UPI00352B4F48